MLQKNTTEKETFQLLRELMLDEKLKRFNLAGGTAIALHLGHRHSVDLDLFTQYDFHTLKIEDYLKEKFNFITDFKEKNTLKGSIKGVKIDCIKSNSPLYRPIQTYEDIRFYSLEDISAMKLLAITDNGSRMKDYIDIAFLSTKFTLDEMIHFSLEKFPNKNPLIIEKALLFYDDIQNEKIDLMKSKFNWKAIEERLKDMVNNKNLIFKEEPIKEKERRQGFRR